MYKCLLIDAFYMYNFTFAVKICLSVLRGPQIDVESLDFQHVISVTNECCSEQTAEHYCRHPSAMMTCSSCLRDLLLMIPLSVGFNVH